MRFGVGCGLWGGGGQFSYWSFTIYVTFFSSLCLQPDFLILFLRLYSVRCQHILHDIYLVSLLQWRRQYCRHTWGLLYDAINKLLYKRQLKYMSVIRLTNGFHVKKMKDNKDQDSEQTKRKKMKRKEYPTTKTISITQFKERGRIKHRNDIRVQNCNIIENEKWSICDVLQHTCGGEYISKREEKENPW